MNPNFGISLFNLLLQELRNMRQRLKEARNAARRETNLWSKGLDAPWTKERLQMFVQDSLRERKIFVVSNREPYIHSKVGEQLSYFVPASGIVTALEPVMQATGGTWIAYGSGDADRLVVDDQDRVAVPPYDPRYTLKRVWLSEEEEKGYYYGFANGGLWPLCHMAHTRPVFKNTDWDSYKEVNAKFAEALLAEIQNEKHPVILIQDFHFALLPKLIKERRRDAVVGIFWHIPWPNAESFSICPWKKEILQGMLGADLIGFHTQFHCNNFMDTVGCELEALIAWDKFTVTKDNHRSFIKAFPISIDFNDSPVSDEQREKHQEESRQLRESLGITSEFIGVGVDRLDYTKGILERFKAVEIFLEKHPSYMRRFTFIQLSSPSRTSVKEYADFAHNVVKEVERINKRFEQEGWKPIVYIKEHKDHKYIDTLYRVAHFCLVTSLHDGMNLVSKEFVVSRYDERGVLILSQFAGAAQDLRGAVVINPYDGEQTADAILKALQMSGGEQKSRMKRMREEVKNHNVFRWSAELLKTLVDLG